MLYSGRKLAQDLSYSELMGMRDSGMTNQEIADSLGVTYPTVLRVIGKQPHEMSIKARAEGRRNITRARRSEAEEAASKPVEDDEEAPVMLVDERFIRVCGMAATYEISDKQRIVKATIGGCCTIEIPFDEAESMIETLTKELRYVSKKVKEIDANKGLENWA